MIFRLALLGLGLGLAAPAASAQAVSGITPGGIAWEMSGSGPAIVLIPGSNLDRRLWVDVVDSLAAAHRVMRYDLRAHGASADVTGPFSNVDDLAEVMDVTGLHRASLVGLSAGSTVALDFALTHPDRVERLVLVSPWPGGMQPAERPAYLQPLVEKLRAGDVTGAAELLAATPVFSARAERAALARQMVLDNARLFRQDGSQARSLAPPAIARLAEVAVPTLVVFGADDGTDIRRAADTLASTIPGARRLDVAGAGHLIPLWTPEAFIAAVLDFVGRTGPGGTQ
jgi:2-succinyl-6-hydroxy-2,4-cyclohexadiene-1-carboxylate synthase